MRTALVKRTMILFVFVLLLQYSNNTPAENNIDFQGGKILISQFTSSGIRIDGEAETAWKDAKPSPFYEITIKNRQI